MFKINSPLYNELYNIFLTEPINENTQLKIEKFLKNQVLNKFLELRKKDEDKELNIDFKIVNTTLIKELDTTKSDLSKLIRNLKDKIYNKNNISLDEDIVYKIIYFSEESFLISVMYGRLLRIISNNGRITPNTKATDVYIDIGRDVFNNYLLNLYYYDQF